MDKIDRLLHAIEHPGQYTAHDIDAMLADPEVREVYNLICATKSALAPTAAPDVDAEWEAFNENHKVAAGRRAYGRRFFDRLSRNAAAGIAIGIASLAAVAAVVEVSINHAANKKADALSADVAAVSTANAVTADTTAVEEDIPALVPETIVFDNEPLDSIANRIANHYGHKVIFTDETPKTLRLYFRWNRAQTLDEVIESLNNFGQIHITAENQSIIID